MHSLLHALSVMFAYIACVYADHCTPDTPTLILGGNGGCYNKNGDLLAYCDSSAACPEDGAKCTVYDAIPFPAAKCGE
ncbi:hypothetical protein AC579_2284 [Pseudocercospora musae]|uniref:Uncharacterized protein n=1 Tax=Pseudocercospora musae TaxID=113226 RepID=A0A139IUR7_9PEZI|nr:hypothetical protein AC579_2284 [Pseudocercospora musae]